MNTAVAIGAGGHSRAPCRSRRRVDGVPPRGSLYRATKRVSGIVNAALDVAREPGRMVVLGIPPTKPETGFRLHRKNRGTDRKKGFRFLPCADSRRTRQKTIPAFPSDSFRQRRILRKLQSGFSVNPAHRQKNRKPFVPIGSLFFRCSRTPSLAWLEGCQARPSPRFASHVEGGVHDLPKLFGCSI